MARYRVGRYKSSGSFNERCKGKLVLFPEHSIFTREKVNYCKVEDFPSFAGTVTMEFVDRVYDNVVSDLREAIAIYG